MKRAHETCPTSLALRKTQIKTPWMTRIFKKTDNSKCGHRCGETGPLTHCQVSYKMAQLLWKTIWQFLERLHREYVDTQQSHS